MTDTQAGISKKQLLTLTALGIVYGDIGTSPLYAFRECFNGKHATSFTPDNVLGILSLIFWSLILVISIKYLFVVMRADHEGEGGVLALMQSALSTKSSSKYGKLFILIIGLFGAALLYGDGILTPAISVLSAVEGLELINPAFDQWVIPLTIIILILLFAGQRFGTSKVGLLFGPVMLLWFFTIGVLGLIKIIQVPIVLRAINPAFAVHFISEEGLRTLFVLGAVFLVVTGGEALYADLGHFGKKAIRQAWFFIVLPGLLLNYFGQGALLLSDKNAIINPFFHMVDKSWLYPLIIFSTLATIIASQAIISGAFSLTYQAIQLKYLPFLKIVHTSSSERGQVYIPKINQLLLVLTVLVVVLFRSSANLAVAYGIAITVTMIITDLLLFFVIRNQWKWSLPISIALITVFLCVDIVYFASNSLKIIQGGWFPLSIAILIFSIFWIWIGDSKKLKKKLRLFKLPLDSFLSNFDRRNYFSYGQTAIYLSSDSNHTPSALQHNLEHNHVIHKKVVFLEINFSTIPRVPNASRMEVMDLRRNFYQVKMNFGYMEKVDMSDIIALWKSNEFLTEEEMKKMTFFVSNESLRDQNPGFFHKWRNSLFSILQKSNQNKISYFNIPANMAFEIGKTVEITKSKS